jgi:hypothetical protein
MSNTKNNGGPAFPRQHDWSDGMTLRDYFAAKALQGWLAMYANDTLERTPPPESAATIAYAYADAMLKAREQ